MADVDQGLQQNRQFIPWLLIKNQPYCNLEYMSDKAVLTGIVKRGQQMLRYQEVANQKRKVAAAPLHSPPQHHRGCHRRSSQDDHIVPLLRGQSQDSFPQFLREYEACKTKIEISHIRTAGK